MSPAPGEKEKASEVGTTRLEPWLHKGVTALAKIQNTSASAKIAQYTEEGFRRELNSIDFNELVARENKPLEEAAQDLIDAHTAVLAMIANRAKASAAPKGI